MLEAFQSFSAAERLRAAGAFLERSPAATEVLIVGASRDAVDDLARRVTAQLEEGKVADRAALLAIATRAAAQGALDLVRRMPMVLLDVPIAGPAERAFVDALTAISPAVLVTVPAGDDATLDAVQRLGARDRTDEPSDAD